MSGSSSSINDFISSFLLIKIPFGLIMLSFLKHSQTIEHDTNWQMILANFNI